MDEILHHFETMGSWFVGIYRGSIIPGLLKVVQEFVHPQYVVNSSKLQKNMSASLHRPWLGTAALFG